MTQGCNNVPTEGQIDVNSEISIQIIEFEMKIVKEKIDLVCQSCIQSFEVYLFVKYGYCFYQIFQGHRGFFHSTSLATWGSNWVSKEAKFFTKFNFLGFVCYFSAKIEQNTKTSKIKLKSTCFGWFFEVYSILAEKQRTKLRRLNSLKNLAYSDKYLDPQGARLAK